MDKEEFPPLITRKTKTTTTITYDFDKFKLVVNEDLAFLFTFFAYDILEANDDYDIIENYNKLMKRYKGRN